jgi:hypothetical protein
MTPATGPTCKPRLTVGSDAWRSKVSDSLRNDPAEVDDHHLRLALACYIIYGLFLDTGSPCRSATQAFLFGAIFELIQDDFFAVKRLLIDDGIFAHAGRLSLSGKKSAEL